MSTLRASLVASIGTALVGLVAFGGIHAVWITPIWLRLLGGFPFALAGAGAGGWAYAECRLANRLPGPAALGGVVFGLGGWLAMVPSTVAGTLLRLTGIHQRSDTVSTAIELGAAVVTGVLLGRWLHRGRRATLALGVAVVALLLTQAGPVPVINGRRPTGLFLLLASVYMLGGLVQALLTKWLEGAGLRPHAQGRE